MKRMPGDNVLEFPLTHIFGQAVCLCCDHEWRVKEPIGTLYFKCPECWAYQGVIMPEDLD